MLFMDDEEISVVEEKTLAKDSKQGSCMVLENEKWSDLPLDLLMLVTESLSLADYFHMSSTCKSWRRAVPSVWSPQTLLLLFIEDRKIKFFDPSFKNIYVALSIPKLLDATFHYSKDGWLLLSRNNLSQLFFFNPFTSEEISLPKISCDEGAFLISFSSPPTSQDCVVFLILGRTYHYAPPYNYLTPCQYVTIHICSQRDENWKWLQRSRRRLYHSKVFLQYLFKDLFENQQAYNNLIYFNKDFYYLNTRGTLAIFMYTSSMIQHVKKPKCLSSGNHHCYLVESEGEILSIFRHDNHQIQVFQLDHDLWVWIEIKSLGDNVLFLDRLTSLSTPAAPGEKENQIYFPAFQRDCNDPVFYSLETEGFSREFSNCKEHVRQIWVDAKGFELVYGTKYVLGKVKDR